MENSFNWGIIGAGRIARKFAEGLSKLPRANLLAIASRSLDRASLFQEEFDIPLAYEDYQEMVRHPKIDIVYVATTHNFHKEHGLLCLEHGKALLCEKPLTVNAQQAQELISKAREKNLFLMEAMWTRFNPVVLKVKEWVESGLIGEVKLVEADFGFSAKGGPEHRTFNPQLAGGALLDVGLYPIYFANMIFGGFPTEVHSTADVGATGVDETSAYTFRYEGGGIAQLSSSVRVNTAKSARISGTEGYIEIPLFWRANEASLYNIEGNKVAYSEGDSGLHFQAKAVMDCLEKGIKEHPYMPLDESLNSLKLMDALRAAWGVKYPFE